MLEKVDEKLSFVSAAVYQLLRIVILPSLSSFYLSDIIMDIFYSGGDRILEDFLHKVLEY